MRYPERVFWIGLVLALVIVWLFVGCVSTKIPGVAGGGLAPAAPSNQAGVPWFLWAAGVALLVAGASAGAIFKAAKSAAWYGGTGVALLGFCFVLTFVATTSPWLIKWSYAILVLALLGAGLDWYLAKRKAFRTGVTLNAIVPAIETAEPKKESNLASGPIKASVAAHAAAAGTSAVVSAEVAAVKKKMGL